MSENRKNRNKGITLISLVIIIVVLIILSVVLIILSGISIGMLTEENEIISDAIKAEEEARSAGIQEKIRLMDKESVLFKGKNLTKLDEENVKNELIKEGYIEEKDTIEISGYDGMVIINKDTDNEEIITYRELKP